MNHETRKGLTTYTPDEMIALYKTNPVLFDELADEALHQACVGKTPEQTLKKQRMQWGIDMRLRKAKTPQERMQTMEGIFYGQVFGLNGQLARLTDNCTELLHIFTGTDRAPAAAKPKIRLLKR